MNIVRKIFSCKKDKNITIREEIKQEHEKSLSDLKKLNKRLRIVLEKGDIEIIIRNVDGIIKELKL